MFMAKFCAIQGIGSIVLILLASCNRSIFPQKQVSPDLTSCPSSPTVEMSLREADVFLLKLEAETTRLSGATGKYQHVGYAFNIENATWITYNIPASENLCLWLYGPDLKILHTGTSVERTLLSVPGKYVLQLGALKSSGQSFSFDLTLTSTNASLARPKSSPDDEMTPDRVKTASPSSSSVYTFTATDYPKSTCGDSPPEDSDRYPLSFYPVIVPYSSSNLNRIKTSLCGDAYQKKHRLTNKEYIQVASFSSRKKALAFVKFISPYVDSAELDQPTTLMAKP